MKTVAQYIASDLLEVEHIVARAITFHPLIGHKVYSTQVSWEPGFKRTAGQFNAYEGIKLHPGLLGAPRRDLVTTFLHELAHAMQHYKYGKVDHQETWWEMMHQLGQKPQTYHSINECMKKVQPKTLGLNAEDLGL